MRRIHVSDSHSLHFIQIFSLAPILQTLMYKEIQSDFHATYDSSETLLLQYPYSYFWHY